MQGPIAEETPGTTADEEKLQAQIATLEEKLRYTERKLTAALGQLRDGTVVGEVDRLGRRAALMLTLGTGRPYQALLHDVDPDWLAPEDMGLLRRYGQEGFFTMQTIWHGVFRTCWRVTHKPIRHGHNPCRRHWPG